MFIIENANKYIFSNNFFFKFFVLYWKTNNFSVFYDPRLFTHDPRLCTRDPRLFTRDTRPTTVSLTQFEAVRASWAEVLVPSDLSKSMERKELYELSLCLNNMRP